MPDSRVSAEDVKRATRAVAEVTECPLGAECESCRDLARAVLLSIEAVPRATCEKHTLTVYSHLRCPYCHIEQAVARAESAEARCESYRTALRRIVEKGDQVVDTPDGGKSIVVAVSREAEECAGIARAALAVPQEGKPR